jgi:hypothetical protein
MGAAAPYFTVLPVPAAGVPTNAALVTSQHMAWSVRVLDAGREVPVEIGWLSSFGSGDNYSVVRPLAPWPAKRRLELHATQEGTTSIETHAFTTAAGPHTEPPRTTWSGPIGIQPRGPTMPPGSWPTNFPRPPENERTFVLPSVQTGAGYLVVARLWLEDGAQAWCTEGALGTASGVSIGLTPPSGDFTDAARIVGLALTDLAGNTARYGKTDG